MRFPGARLGLLAVALAASSQPLNGLPADRERLCGNAAVPDTPHGEPRSSVSASNDELPALPPWCDEPAGG